MSLSGFVRSAVCIMALLAPANAQTDPDDPGTGVKLGVEQLNNSGQVGTVSLYERGRRKTLVVLKLYSVPARSEEAASVRRGHACRRTGEAVSIVALTFVARGVWQTDVALPLRALLSGNYLVEAFAAPGSRRRVACGQLYGRVSHKEDRRPR